MIETLQYDVWHIEYCFGSCAKLYRAPCFICFYNKIKLTNLTILSMSSFFCSHVVTDLSRLGIIYL